jgi:hypothetical protein
MGSVEMLGHRVSMHCIYETRWLDHFMCLGELVNFCLDPLDVVEQFLNCLQELMEGLDVLVASDMTTDFGFVVGKTIGMAKTSLAPDEENLLGSAFVRFEVTKYEVENAWAYILEG